MLFSNCCFAQHDYNIEVNISNSSGKKIYLADAMGGPNDRSKVAKVDSLIAINDKCVFKGTFKEMGYYSLAVGGKKNYASFIIDTGTVVINGSAQDYLWKSLSVSSIQNNWAKEAEKVIDSLSKNREKFQDSMFKYEATDKKRSLGYAHWMDTVDRQMANYLMSFTIRHPDSYYAFNKLKAIYYYTPEVSKIARQTLPLFSQQIQNSTEGGYLRFHLNENYKDLLINKALPAIKVYYKNGTVNEIKLDSGKVYLIDYWASWCVPCIAKLPAIKKLKNRFGKKGLKIISISLDNNQNNWLRAVQKYKIDWENYCDLNGFSSNDTQTFGINSIPFMILVDRNGKMVKLDPTIKEAEDFLTKL